MGRFINVISLEGSSSVGDLVAIIRQWCCRTEWFKHHIYLNCFCGEILKSLKHPIVILRKRTETTRTLSKQQRIYKAGLTKKYKLYFVIPSVFFNFHIAILPRNQHQLCAGTNWSICFPTVNSVAIFVTFRYVHISRKILSQY